MAHPRSRHTLDADQRLELKAVAARCPELGRLRRQLSGYAEIMTQRRGHELGRWMRAARSEQIPELSSFVTGLRHDLDAVRAGMTLTYSSGVVEGHVNWLKKLKRQMYGRANPDLLRKRVLLAA
ncbi:Transposase IS204/IS1001/IS1096/IS1165 DDE domain-containing protein [Nocardiopsis rhodophaea]